jgi:hypothetical protein
VPVGFVFENLEWGFFFYRNNNIGSLLVLVHLYVSELSLVTRGQIYNFVHKRRYCSPGIDAPVGFVFENLEWGFFFYRDNNIGSLLVQVHLYVSELSLVTRGQIYNFRSRRWGSSLPVCARLTGFMFFEHFMFIFVPNFGLWKGTHARVLFHVFKSSFHFKQSFGTLFK